MPVLKRPVLSEKFNDLGEKHQQYGFIVDKRATKEEIKREVQSLYNVDVVRVNTMVYAGKRKTRYTRRSVVEGRKPSYKKAVITLAPGQVIDFYSNV